MNDPKPIVPARTLAIFTGLNLLNYVDRYIFPAVATPLKHDLGIDDEQFGRLATTFMIGYFLTAPFFGYLGDRVPRKWLIALGVTIWSVGTIFFGFAHGLIALFALRIMVGVGEASYGTLSPGWIADLYPSGKRNQALAWFYLAMPVGTAIAFKLGGWMATNYDWRLAFMWAGAPGLVLAVAVLFLREPARGASEAESTRESVPDTPGWRVYLRLFGLKTYVLVIAGYVGYTFAMGGFVVWAAQFFERVHGMDLEAADNFFGLSVIITGIFATMLGAWIAAAWQRRSPAGNAWLLALSALAAVPTVFAAFLLDDPAAARVALAVAMFLLFLSTGPVNTVILEVVPVTMRASAMAAAIFAIHFFGDLWSPWIVGVISDRVHDLRSAVLWTLPPAVAVCAFCWCWLALRMRGVNVRN
ncbi:MAG: MFS transporter [Opitutaceae bacterium]